MSSQPELSPSQLEMMKQVDRAIEHSYPIIGIITKESRFDILYIRGLCGSLYDHELDEINEIVDRDDPKAVFHYGKTYTDFTVQIIMAAEQDKPEDTTDNQKAVALITWILMDSNSPDRDKIYADIFRYRSYCFGEKEASICKKYFKKGAIAVWIHISEDAKPVKPVYPMSSCPIKITPTGFAFLRPLPSSAYYTDEKLFNTLYKEDK